MNIPWKPWVQSPDCWLMHIAQIGSVRWLTLGQRIDEPGLGEHKFVVRVHEARPTPRDMWNGVIKGATWEGDDVIAFHCIIWEFCKEYGDERCKDGRLWGAGARP